ncbi:MAG: RNA-binding transcriptional accessory protein [Bacillaceae bacterium G1]|nr:RNA-binding transcriptional accessory protein [Bacillota bacterium]OJF16635.1 MAG: RNA-binding transcriptional accessory protein [Bacillaceae bacterium G1]
MKVDDITRIAQELGIGRWQVERTIQLLDEGNTIPFIARYRKEMTGELNELQIRHIQERARQLRQLQSRREEIARLIEEQGNMTPELAEAIQKAATVTELEDLYRPYRPKRKTRASAAREKGLAPLAEWLLQEADDDVQAMAARYISEEKQVLTAEEALAGALDIVAETVADDAAIRQWLREWTLKHGVLVSRAQDAARESVYEAYYDYREPVRKVPPHRILAVNRGEREGVLKVTVEVPTDELWLQLEQRALSRHASPRISTAARSLLATAVRDAYRRLLAPAVERDIRNFLTEKAEEQAIRIFSENLRQLLLQPPVRGKVVLGVDPAYRTGCKLAVVDETGKLLDVAVAYPHPPQRRAEEAKAVFLDLIHRHQVDVIAIGNGTACRETEQFVASLIPACSRPVVYTVVSEAGASVYSASPVAAEEFPQLDVSERSAVSIARRLQDPLAELVKIDPKSIGVGQYQHDVSQKRLEEQLAFVVESAVNTVGVDLNTASVSLLSYVSGLNKAVAREIVAWREQHGKFARREELLQVPRLGPKTFEQAAGFLRIPDGENPLDNTPIHPESQEKALALLSQLGFTAGSLRNREERAALVQRLDQLDLPAKAEELGIGLPTLQDMVNALKQPGRDPREELPPPLFRRDVMRMEELVPGMILQGTVRNVVDFGAFVDVGLEQDGLIHISELAEHFVRHPLDVVAVGQIVRVRVLDVDRRRQRIALSMKGIQQND